MIVIDVETTGLDFENCSIVSIGALNFFNPSDQFYMECRIWDGAEVSEEALAINGMTNEQLHDPVKPTEAEAVQAYVKWTEDKIQIFAGQNVHFDRNFINAALKRAGIKKLFSPRTLDQHSIVLSQYLAMGLPIPTHNRKSSLDSDTIMSYVGIPPEPRPHNALNGALWEFEALHRLIYQRHGLDQFKEYAIPDHLHLTHKEV